MKKKLFGKKSKLIQDDNKDKNQQNDIVESVGSFLDFLIMEKTSNIKESILEFENVESENNFLKDFLVLQHKPIREKSRFTDFFKEISEQKDTEQKEEPKIENSNIQIPLINPAPQNIRFDSYENVPNAFNSNMAFNKINFSEKEKQFNKNHFSNPNSRAPSDFSFFGRHECSFSSKSTNTNSNTFYKTSSAGSVENNIINFQGGGMNNIFNNNKNNKKFIEKEKEFEPYVVITKVLSLEDKRNTIMIKNIPNKFTREKLLDLIDKNFKGSYDLFILPKDGNKNRNFGYAFINFISSYYIPYFYYIFNGKKWTDTNSQKICEITYSKIQGRNELISHYPNKIIFFNDILDMNNTNKFFIPKDYLMLFKQIFPNHPIEENNFGFFTKIPFIF